MNCTEAMNDLPELACGILDGERKQSLETHLAACGRCCAEYTALRQVSRLLRTTTAPAVRVDVEALYREAARRDRRCLRRWRRLAGVAAIAAALLLILFGLKLEVYLEHHQVVVRWGTPPPREIILPAPAPVPPVAVRPPVDEQRLRALNDLLLLLAADVQALDLRQQQELARLRTVVERLQQQSTLHWEAAERDVEALETLCAQRFQKKKGE